MCGGTLDASLSAPRRLCALLVLAGLIGSLLPAPCTYAQSSPPGSYTGPNLSGGQTTAQGSPPGGYSTLNLLSGPLYGANNNGTSPACGGQIEAQWIWTANQPNAPVPQQVIVKQVIVKQFCDASWESSTASGQCDDALKDPPVSSTSSGDTTAHSSGTHYRAVPADANGNLEVYCTPTASVAKGSCGVYYRASASPVFINLSGPTQDSSGNYNILVGQECTASLTPALQGCTYSNAVHFSLWA